MNVLRRAAVRLYDGSVIVWRSRVAAARKWVSEPEVWWERVLRAALLAVPAYVVVRLLRGHPKLMWIAAALWCWAAFRATRGHAPVASTGDAAAEQLEDVAVDVSPAEFLRIVRAAIGEARGVHLVTLVEQLVEQHPGRPWTTRDVRDLCSAAGVRVRPVVRAPGRGPTVGVHKDDLPALPLTLSPGADVAVVVAGQPTTTPPTTPPATPVEQGGVDGHGRRFVTEPDTQNPHRTHVRWSA